MTFCVSIRTVFLIILMCIGLPACVKKENTVANQVENKQRQSLNFMQECKQSPIDNDIDGRFAVVDTNNNKAELKKSTRNTHQVVNGISADEAKWFDIPVPLQAVSQGDCLDDQDDRLFVRYSVFLDRQAIVDFYEREMERLGWQHEMESINDQESLLIFSKPTKICAVSLRSSSDTRRGLAMVITVGPKKMDVS